MLILVDDAEHRARLIESIQRRVDQEVEEIARTICNGGLPNAHCADCGCLPSCWLQSRARTKGRSHIR